MRRARVGLGHIFLLQLNLDDQTRIFTLGMQKRLLEALLDTLEGVAHFVPLKLLGLSAVRS